MQYSREEYGMPDAAGSSVVNPHFIKNDSNDIFGTGVWNPLIPAMGESPFHHNQYK